MILELTDQEVIDIINVLGELPTKSNAWPLKNKIAGQLEAAQADKEPTESSAASE